MFYFIDYDECTSVKCQIFDNLGKLHWGLEQNKNYQSKTTERLETTTPSVEMIEDYQDKSTKSPETTSQSNEEIEDELDKINNKLREHLKSSELLAASEELKILLDDETLYDNRTLNKTIAILEIMADKTTDLDESDLSDYNDNNIECIDKLIDQELAWVELDTTTMTKYGSHLLDLIETIGHKSGGLDNGKDQVISKENILIKKFLVNKRKPVFFKVKNYGSSINVNGEIEIHKHSTNCSQQIAVGSFIKKLSIYMGDKLKNKTTINSDIVSLSFGNTKEVVYFDSRSVEIRYTR